MSSFTEILNVDYIDGENWEVKKEFAYHVGEKESDEIIVVPAGFITDFASIPKPIRNIFPPTDKRWGKAAVIHDYLYRNLGLAKYDRKRCDKIFLEGMVVLNADWLSRTIIYNAVRMFAGGAWKKYEKASKK